MNDDLKARVEYLEAYVAALEEERANLGARLQACNAIRQASGAKLRAAIEQIIAKTPELTAKGILRRLAMGEMGREKLPSIRVVQWHAQAVRNTLALRSAQAN